MYSCNLMKYDRVMLYNKKFCRWQFHYFARNVQYEY